MKFIAVLALVFASASCTETFPSLPVERAIVDAGAPEVEAGSPQGMDATAPLSLQVCNSLRVKACWEPPALGKTACTTWPLPEGFEAFRAGNVPQIRGGSQSYLCGRGAVNENQCSMGVATCTEVPQTGYLEQTQCWGEVSITLNIPAELHAHTAVCVGGGEACVAADGGVFCSKGGVFTHVAGTDGPIRILTPKQYFADTLLALGDHGRGYFIKAGVAINLSLDPSADFIDGAMGSHYWYAATADGRLALGRVDAPRDATLCDVGEHVIGVANAWNGGAYVTQEGMLATIRYGQCSGAHIPGPIVGVRSWQCGVGQIFDILRERDFVHTGGCVSVP